MPTEAPPNRFAPGTPSLRIGAAYVPAYCLSLPAIDCSFCNTRFLSQTQLRPQRASIDLAYIRLLPMASALHAHTQQRTPRFPPCDSIRIERWRGWVMGGRMNGSASTTKRHAYSSPACFTATSGVGVSATACDALCDPSCSHRPR